MSRAHDSTIHDDPESRRQDVAAEVALWVIACPEPAKVQASFRLASDEPFLLGRKVERGGAAFDDPRMSRVHARIVWDGRTSCFRVGDAGSANGTFVDGRRVQTARLAHGSVVRTGNTVCVIAERDPLPELEQRITRAAPSDASVLLLGETGTGKELAARKLHELSGRSGDFVAVNTATLPRELLATELFGHARGAFSGAREERAGLFRAAAEGTLFLDEIGDFPLELQPALLRVLEERSVRPLGSERLLEVNVRVVAATHQDLRARVDGGLFRLDLYARLAQVELRVPPLRERRHTLPSLLSALALAEGMVGVEVSADAMETLALHRFDQNVRELKNLVGRLKIFGTPPFELDLAFLEREAPDVADARRHEAEPAVEREAAAPDEITHEKLVALLERHGQRVADAARELGTSRTQIYRWMKRFGLETPSSRR